MAAEAVVRDNFVDQVYRAIKGWIVSGELAAGTQLKTEVLSRRLGVSNSPIREALRRLENERWVQTIPYRGSFVRPFDAQELAELYEIREIIEVAALEKVMPSPNVDDLAALARAAEAIHTALRAGDSMGYLKADAEFHQKLVDMAGNNRLSAIYQTLVEQGRCFSLGREPAEMARIAAQPDQHDELVALMGAGQTVGAVAFLRQHLRESVRR